MSRNDDDSLYGADIEESELSSQLDQLMSLLEESEIEFNVRKSPGGKRVILDNNVIFSFNNDNELVSIVNKDGV